MSIRGNGLDCLLAAVSVSVPVLLLGGRTVAPLRERDGPTGASAASGAVPLKGLLLSGFRRFAFVDQEGPNSATAFTLENVRWHSIPS